MSLKSFKGFRHFLFFGLVLFFLNSVFSVGFYGDLVFDVDNSGSVSISGTTNAPSFQNITLSPKFTSKNGEFWMLNISSKEVFDEFVYELILPENSNINYVKTTRNFRIAQDGSRLKIIGLGDDQRLEILVQYKVGVGDNDYFSVGFYVILGIFLVVCVIIFFMLYRYTQTQKRILEKQIVHKQIIENVLNTGSKESSKKEMLNYEVLNERQKQIISIIKSSKVKLTQKQIESEMSIPKSSVSRNIASLVARKYLIKENVGQSNFISLNPELEY